jgi:arylsulfatase A-like enzyme
VVHTLPFSSAASRHQNSDHPNILVVLFDALSAEHLSLYGYPRHTSPNLDRFAEGATVYHNHHSAGNYTTPSTASLFTGTYPWTHRAINLSSLVSPNVQSNNLFDMMDERFYQAAFAQNTFADMLLHQFGQQLDLHEALDRSSLAGRVFYDDLTPRDAIYGMKSMDQFLFKREEAHGSLFFSIFNDLATQLAYKRQTALLKSDYPSGPPRLANTDVYFHIGQVMDGVIELLAELPAPYFTYLHFMPPHMPYVPRRAFIGRFDDGWAPPLKKKHRLAPGVSQERLNQLRTTYDEFIADLDSEFGRLIDSLEASGRLDDSYVIFTSDHGELFERGVSGHSTPLMFEPLIHIPLVIHVPGQTQRKDVYSLTSNVDLLPSFAHIAGLLPPDWCEGRPLPEMGGESDPQREVFVVEAKANPAFERLRKASFTILRLPYKLVSYRGYKHYQNEYELYNLEDDPGEQQNLYPNHPMAQSLQVELDQIVDRINAPYP